MSQRPFQQLSAAWDVIIGAANRRSKLTYGDLAQEIGGIARGMGPLLGRIQSHCEQNGLPLLTALVVRASDGKPGPGFGTHRDPQQEQARVWAYAWDNVRNPFL